MISRLAPPGEWIRRFACIFVDVARIFLSTAALVESRGGIA